MLSPLLIKSKLPCQMQACGDDDIVLLMGTKNENLTGNFGMHTNAFNQNQRSWIVGSHLRLPLMHI